MRATTPVSYTHLDVYKRQVQHWISAKLYAATTQYTVTSTTVGGYCHSTMFTNGDVYVNPTSIWTADGRNWHGRNVCWYVQHWISAKLNAATTQYRVTPTTVGGYCHSTMFTNGDVYVSPTSNCTADGRNWHGRNVCGYVQHWISAKLNAATTQYRVTSTTVGGYCHSTMFTNGDVYVSPTSICTVDGRHWHGRNVCWYVQHWISAKLMPHPHSTEGHLLL